MAGDGSGTDRSAPDDARAGSDESAVESHADDSPGSTADGDGWGRIPIDLSDDRDPGSAADGPEDAPDDEPYAPEPRSTPIQPGTPSLENAAFVLLGALLTIVVMFRLFTIMLG